MSWKSIIVAVAAFVVGGFASMTLFAAAMVLAVEKVNGGPIGMPPNYLTPALDAPDLGAPGEALASRYVKAAEAQALALAQVATEVHYLRSAVHIVACSASVESEILFEIRWKWLSCEAYGDSL